MASLPTIKEIRAMNVSDLKAEIAEQSSALSKMKLDVALQSEKDTAKLRRLRKVVARMHTISTEKEAGAPELKPKPKSSRVSAPKNS